MLILNKNEYNEFILYLNEDKSLDDPYYIFNFVDIYNRSTVKTLEDLSTASSYNKFGYYDSSDFSLYANGTYYVYESALDSSVIDVSTMNLLEYGLYKLQIDNATDVIFDPSISVSDSVFDPSSNKIRTNEDYIFDPVWVSGDLPAMGIPASQIIQDSTHRFLYDSSIESYENIINTENIGLVVDAQGTAISSGSKGYKNIGFNGVITDWTLLSDVSGNINIEINKASFSQWPDSSTITNGYGPSLNNINKDSSTDISNWDSSLSNGDILEFTVDGSVDNITKIWLLINIRKI